VYAPPSPARPTKQMRENIFLRFYAYGLLLLPKRNFKTANGPFSIEI